MNGKTITISTRSVGKTTKTRERTTGKRVLHPEKPASQTSEAHRGTAADVLSAFAELYRQL